MHMLNSHYVNRTRGNAPMEKKRSLQKLNIMGNLEVSLPLKVDELIPLKFLKINMHPDRKVEYVNEMISQKITHKIDTCQSP